MKHLTIALLAITSSATVGIAQAPDWQEVLTASNPGPRVESGMAFDSLRNRCVLFGGYVSGTNPTDTWEFDGSSWTEVTGLNNPSERYAHGMAYDAARGKVVMFGGIYDSASSSFPGYDETWEFDGNDWALATPTTRPPGRFWAPIAYDSVRQKIVLFGGWAEGFGDLNDTWEFDGSDWTQITPNTSPSPRASQAMSYDSARQKVVMFGGYGGYTSFPETWEYDGSTWTQVATTNNPPYTTEMNIAYDSLRQKTVLFGDFNWGNNNSTNGTWEYDGSDWTQVTTTNTPTRRLNPAMAYDSTRGQVVMYGGTSIINGSFTDLLDTWEYSAPGPAASASTYGSGCGNPALTFIPTSLPLVGSTATAYLGLTPTPIAAVSVGFSNTVHNGTPLPIDLSGIGMTGCMQLQSQEALALPVSAGLSSTTLRFDLAIPYDVTWLGLPLYLQGYCVAPGANPIGVIVSNGIEWTIGNY